MYFFKNLREHAAIRSKSAGIMQVIGKGKWRNNSRISRLFKVISQVAGYFDVVKSRGSGKKCEPACKPGSVEDNYSSAACVTADLKRPTRIQCEQHFKIPIWPCSGWGLPCHVLLPVARCALTAPFHPYLLKNELAVCFLLH